MKYVVTGISRLTGRRETVSRPTERLEAVRLLEFSRRMFHRASAYRDLQLREAAFERELF